MPPKKNVVAGASKTVAPVDDKNTIRIRVEKFSKMTEDVLSEVKEIGGFPWQLKISPPSISRGPPGPTLYLSCLYSRVARVWHCKADRKWRIVDVKGEWLEVTENRYEKIMFAANKPSQFIRGVMDNFKQDAKKYVANDTIEIEVEIDVHTETADRFRKKLPIDFLSSSELFDAELAVGDKKIYVNKQFLSMHSPVFMAHFYGNTKEKLKLDDEDPEAFIEFLKMLYRVENVVNATNVEKVLEMAERFKVQCLVDHVEKYLYKTSDVKLSEKIRIAEKYNLNTAMKGSLNDIKREKVLGKKLMESAEFKEYSAKTKKEIKDATTKPSKYVDSDEEEDDEFDEDESDDDGEIDDEDLADAIAQYMNERGLQLNRAFF